MTSPKEDQQPMTTREELVGLAERGFTPIETTWKADKQYFKFMCSKCGNEGRNTYCEPAYTQMLERKLCWNCNFWVEEEKRYEKEHLSMTIIDGHVYAPGSRTSGPMRGMAGRRFDIEYIEPSIYAGQRTTTFDLWSGSTMPDHLRAKFPDTARFLGGAEKAQVGETVCWNHTMERSEPYPLPNALKPTARALLAEYSITKRTTEG
jgi:hypothetical protein